MAGAETVHVVGGVEHMQHLPMESAIDVHPQVNARSSKGMLSMGLTAEHLAAANRISRRAQESYALESHRRAAAAADAGLFDDEIVTVLGHDDVGAVVEATRDQSIRADASLEAMAALEPAFLPSIGTVTEVSRRPAGLCSPSSGSGSSRSASAAGSGSQGGT